MFINEIKKIKGLETIEEYNSRLGELNSLCPLCEEREATEEGPYGVELCFDCLNKIRR